jgi:hypothetical protein
VLKTAGPGLYALIARPADGSKGGAAALPVIVTDLGLTAWRGPQGLAVQARAFGAGRPLAGVQVRLLATSNDILAEAVTEADGTARFAAPLLRGQGPMAPRALHATLGDDLVALDLDAAAFDLSDRGATGAAHPGPLDAYPWLDRGIYRPGETVDVYIAHLAGRNTTIHDEFMALFVPDFSFHLLEPPLQLRMRSNQWHSVAIRRNQTQSDGPEDAEPTSNQWQSDAIRRNQTQSDAIRRT